MLLVWVTYDDRDCELWINSEGTLKVEQREFGPQLRAPPFVAARTNSITVPSYYTAKKQGSGALADRVSSQNSVSGRGKLSKQSQGVMVSTKASIDGDNISSLIRNKVDGNRKEDSGLKANVNEEKTVELNKINEEVCLAKEFGAATLLGSGKRATKNSTSRDNLSDLSQL